MMEDWIRPCVREFKRYYNPDTGNAVRMDTNTNVLGSNPAAKRFLSSAFNDLNDYPNTYSDGLRDALAELYGLERENFVCGSGSDETLDIAFKTFMDWGENVAVPVPSYTLYDYFVSMNGGNVRSVPLTEDFHLDVDSMLSSDVKMMIMPSPNNPTGNSFREKDIIEILEKFNGPVIVDEAYGEYAERSMIQKVNEFENLVVMRTFSKAYAMAALRVGYSVSNTELAERMNCVKIPYSLNKVSEGAAIAATRDQKFIEDSVKLVKENRPILSKGLKDLGFEPFPSDSNFILARCPADHAEFTDGLKKKGVLVRDFGSRKGTENCIRTTVGTRELNDLLLKRSEEVISEIKVRE